MKRVNDQRLQRRADLATIHIAKQQLDMDDDAYRALLRYVSARHGIECSSSADLSDVQRKAVIRELQSKGATSARPNKPGVFPGRPANFDQLPEEITKIEAQLTDMKLSWRYANAIANRMFGVAHIGWCRKSAQLAAIIAALDVEQSKRDLGAAIDAHCLRLGLSADDLVFRFPSLQKLPRWRRNVRLLKLVDEALFSMVQRRFPDEYSSAEGES